MMIPDSDETRTAVKDELRDVLKRIFFRCLLRVKLLSLMRHSPNVRVKDLRIKCVPRDLCAIATVRASEQS